jgi:IstB-like ATP binding protein
VIVTTNLPFSEWTSVIPNARLCKALIDHITDRANIIETGTESYRFRRTLDKRKGKATEIRLNTAPPRRENQEQGNHFRLLGTRNDQHAEGGPNLNIKVGHAALSKSSAQPDKQASES